MLCFFKNTQGKSHVFKISSMHEIKDNE